MGQSSCKPTELPYSACWLTVYRDSQRQKYKPASAPWDLQYYVHSHSAPCLCAPWPSHLRRSCTHAASPTTPGPYRTANWRPQQRSAAFICRCIAPNRPSTGIKDSCRRMESSAFLHSWAYLAPTALICDYISFLTSSLKNHASYKSQFYKIDHVFFLFDPGKCSKGAPGQGKPLCPDLGSWAWWFIHSCTQIWSGVWRRIVLFHQGCCSWRRA